VTTHSASVEPPARIAHRVLSDGEFIVNHGLVSGEGGPAAVRFDMWRIVDGRIADHWSDEEQWAPQTANGHTQIDGPTAIDRTADAEMTRRVATETVQAILVDGDSSSLDKHLAGEEYIQHNPRFADGISGLVAALTALAKHGITMRYDTIRQVVADGDFAYLRSEGTFADQPYMFHDLFRVADGRCAEHWDVMVPRS
jgi:predicted SnoaL-like aldol condensation-catalyzing enzyme